MTKIYLESDEVKLLIRLLENEMKDLNDDEEIFDEKDFLDMKQVVNKLMSKIDSKYRF